MTAGISEVGKIAMALRAHARRLAKIHGVRLIETDQLRWHEAFACRTRRCIFVAPIIDPIAYGTALHELGHLAEPHQAAKIREEEKAWAWARRNALVWTPGMAADAIQALSTYYEREETFSEQKERLGWILALPDDDVDSEWSDRA